MTNVSVNVGKERREIQAALDQAQEQVTLHGQNAQASQQQQQNWAAKVIGFKGQLALLDKLDPPPAPKTPKAQPADPPAADAAPPVPPPANRAARRAAAKAAKTTPPPKK
jgi:hypothetical protein